MSSAKDIKIPTSSLAVEPEKKVRVSLEGKVNSRVNRNEYGYNGHWDFEHKMGKEGFIGFIYIIRNKESGRCYIGKKFYKGTGKLNKGQESNWPWYISSSKELANDIKTLGKDHFEFICLEEYKTKGALSWAETWSLCHAEVPTKQDKWYNLLINKVSWVVKEPVTERHKARMKIVMEME